jgi:hypothetical protein
MLPASSETIIRQAGGWDVRLRTTFSACRQYAGESKLILEETTPEASAPTESAALSLPPGLDLHLRLMETLDRDAVARGDTSVWELTRNVTEHGRVLLARGAHVELRLGPFVCTDSPVPFCLVDLRPSRILVPGLPAPLAAALVQPDLSSTFEIMFRGISRNAHEALLHMTAGQNVQSGVLVRNTGHQLRAGFETVWRTSKSDKTVKQ